MQRVWGIVGAWLIFSANPLLAQSVFGLGDGSLWIYERRWVGIPPAPDTLSVVSARLGGSECYRLIQRSSREGEGRHLALPTQDVFEDEEGWLAQLERGEEVGPSWVGGEHDASGATHAKEVE